MPSNVVTIEDIKEIINIDVFKEIIKYSHVRISKGEIKLLHGLVINSLEDGRWISELLMDISRSELYYKKQVFLFVIRFMIDSKIELLAIKGVLNKCKDTFLKETKKIMSDEEEVKFTSYAINTYCAWAIQKSTPSDPSLKRHLDDLAFDFTLKTYGFYEKLYKVYEERIEELTRSELEVKKGYDNLYRQIKSLQDSNEKYKSNNESLHREIGSLHTQLLSLQREKQTVKTQPLSLKDSFSQIAVKYMNLSRKKSQSYREKVKASLNDIKGQLKVNLPDDIQMAINNFDDAETPPSININITGPITNNGGTITGNINNGK